MPDIVHRGACHNRILSFDDPRQYNNAEQQQKFLLDLWLDGYKNTL
jgi:hypothetical protein